MEPTLRNHFDDSFTFTSADGFQLAFALVDYADSAGVEEVDPKYGKVKVYNRVWGDYNEFTGQLGPTSQYEIETEACKDSDFIDEEGAESQKRFYDIDQRSQYDFDRKR